MREHWRKVYKEAPSLFEHFVTAEDWGGEVSRKLHSLIPITGRDVVELGCGAGHYTRALARGAHRYTATEPEGALLQRAREASSGEAQYRQARGEDLNVSSSSVDLVWASWVVANLPPETRKAVLTEATRVLKPISEGIWLVESHWSSEFMELRGVGPDHSPSRRLIEGAGFSIMAEFDSTIRFETKQAAISVIGGICGYEVAARLKGRSAIGHRVVVLKR